MKPKKLGFSFPFSLQLEYGKKQHKTLVDHGYKLIIKFLKQI